MRNARQDWLFLLVIGGMALACGWFSRKIPLIRPTEGTLPVISPQGPTGERETSSSLRLPGVSAWGVLSLVKSAHQQRPGMPPRALSLVQDRPTGDLVRPGQPINPEGGDTYARNVYERPFKEYTQDTYYPDLDIVEARLSMDDTWVYVDITLYSLLQERAVPTGNYGVELDLDVDGRGDLLIWVQGPVTSTDWADTGVQVYDDPNNDVGAARACHPDAPFNRTGYDHLLFYEARGKDPDLAWVRWVPPDRSNGRPHVQLAFKRALLPDPTRFVWWVWSDAYLAFPGFMDYHDTFLLAQAGSPYPNHPDYPVKALARMDSTCRVPVGFTPSPEDQTCGLCPPQGEVPPDPPKKTCPYTPKGPPGEPPGPACWWHEATSEWWCLPTLEVPRPGTPSGDKSKLPLCTSERREDCVTLESEGREEIAIVLDGEGSEPLFSWSPDEIHRVFGRPEDLVKIQCRWNGETCQWDCDNACLPSMDTLRSACPGRLEWVDFSPDGEPFWACIQGPELLPHTTRYTPGTPEPAPGVPPACSTQPRWWPMRASGLMRAGGVVRA